MFIDLSRHAYLQQIASNVDVISKELAYALRSRPEIKKALLSEKLMDAPSNQWTWDNEINTAAVGYDLRDGNYTMLTLYKPGYSLPHIQKAFTQTLSLLQGVDGLAYACISALGPYAHLGLHRHKRQHYIFHLLLNNLTEGGCEMICNGYSNKMMEKGDAALFDYSLPHETRSRSSSMRFNLMVDFSPKIGLARSAGKKS